tara:strand:+ start:3546 stop:4163 length:618 start_codon:yes stop_codon:yes gene_type:complete
MYVLSRDKNDEFKIKGSLFKAYSFKVNDIISIKDKLSILNDNFLNASHICYAYRICNINNLDLFNNPEIIEFYTDDGEPSGTAGKPILNVLKKNKIINNVIFVIRYFGGTKLGINGLIDSYRYAAELVIKNVTYQDWILFKPIKLKLDYNQYKLVNSIIDQYNGIILKDDFSESILLDIEIPIKEIIQFKKKIIEKSSGTILFIE